MGSMRIKDVVERTGFTAPTLRWYEEIGLLPAAERTPAGYRTYDETAIERLAFIARAKQLGCSIDEIGELVTAWEGGRCGPIQDRLRSLVAHKVTAAQAQIVELTTLTADLHRAAAALEQHRPDGACDDRCGCIAGGRSEGSGAAEIACSLRPDALHDRLGEWHRLLALATARRTLDDGVRVELGYDVPVAELVRLATAEQDCCRFMAFAITIDGRGVGLEARGSAEALPVIETLFGAAAGASTVSPSS